MPQPDDAANRREAAIAAVPTNVDEHRATGRVDVYDPFTGEVIGQVANCGPAEVDAACMAACAAQERGLPQWQRARVLDAVAQLLERDVDRLAGLITLESGKAIRDARGEVGRAAETARFSAAVARTLAGEQVATEATPTGVGKLAIAVRLPVGVVGAISPFNFPLNTVMHKVGPAIAAGCAIVLKPAHQTPLTALALRTLLIEAGLPEDWLTVVTDDRTSAGPALVAHPVPKLITFTGSSEVGWQIAATAYRKKVALELGSNSPVLVAEDADIDVAAAKISKAAYSTSGQSCISVQRVIAHRAVREQLNDALRKHADALTVGDPFDEATDVGPLITPDATARVKSWIDEAAAAGATVAAGGDIVGECLRPTVVDQAPAGTRLRVSEAFGPVLTVIPYESREEAFALANETVYGLQAGLFTSDLNLALDAVSRLEFGGVLVNDVPTTRLDQQPYGGVGESGNTREGPAFTAHEMTETRYVSLQPGGGA
ncbi:aldehyde dehydrogenase family protein [Mycolicibacterium agri]|uniref:Aldehyde dehydrogenase n=1 Tax=Mycolicibacterium agri TaxID=36811 RepID=A0A7I9VW24_MYCAG|nr:aldehyde dehydrogenase family protein [Mycolicibacterium agri]GFG49369.1 aldehyde dehydrogenase [Mycolicibacterium agri]